jgi:hypothetical protein
MHTFSIQSKGHCFLSANTKLVGFENAVCLSSEELADSFRAAVLPTLRRRHGEEVIAIISTCHTSESSFDDLLVTARIAENLFSPNKPPSSICSE